MSFFNKAPIFYPNYLNYHLTSVNTAVNFDISAEPSLTGETYTSSGGETSGAVYDLVDNELTPVITIDTASQSTSPQIDVDTTTNVTANTVIIANHNLNTANADFYIKSGGGPTTATVNSAYSGPRAVTGEYRGASVTVTADLVTVATDGVVIANIDSITSNNLIIDIDANAPGTYSATDLYLGELTFSTRWTSPHSPETNGFQEIDQYGNIVNVSKGGQKYASFYHGLKKRITLAWKNLPQANYDTLRTVFRVTKGSNYPLWVDLGEHATLPYLRYMRLVGDVNANPIAGGLYWNVTLTLEEE